MKHKLLTSTAVGALFALSSVAHAEGWGVRVFGGYNIVGDENQSLGTGTTVFSTGFSGIPQTFFGYIGTVFGTFSFSAAYSAKADFDADGGFVVGAAAGYQWNNGLILELEAAYRKNDLDLAGSGALVLSGILTYGFHTSLPPTFASSAGFYSGTIPFTGGGTASLSGNGDVKAFSLMANVWYEFNIANSHWKPYVGGGVGIAWMDIDTRGSIGLAVTALSGLTTGTSLITGLITTSTTFNIDGDETGFAWQLGAGIGYEFSPGKQLTLDYRYFRGPEIDDVTVSVGGSTTVVDIDYDYEAHSIMLGFKFGY